MRAWPILLTSGVLLCGAASLDPNEQPFRRGNAVAMQRMMADMDAPPTGNVDSDFVAMMVPHHRGAVDMAMLELRYGRNEQLRRIAQGIVVEQRQEIEAMHVALADGEQQEGSRP